MNETKENVDSASRGKRIEETTRTAGWADIQSILEGKWMDGLLAVRNNVVDNEIAMGKAKMEVVEEILNEIKVKVGFGEKARLAMLDRTKI